MYSGKYWHCGAETLFGDVYIAYQKIMQKCIMKHFVVRRVRKIVKSNSDSTGRLFMKFDI